MATTTSVLTIKRGQHVAEVGFLPFVFAGV